MMNRHKPNLNNFPYRSTTLKYLEESNKIAATFNGITWIHNPNPNIKSAITNGTEL
tara:strand:+ start:185 stop:352 length:168 start_codon:yes stop_codon:yes gene_type:complete